jgi:hypothetical protein
MPTCTSCQNPIVAPSPIATYENRHYHPDCLKCNICKKSVSGKHFIKEKNGNLTCEDCNEKYSPKCYKCSKSFGPGQTYKKLSENVYYHNDCFICAGPCGISIAGEFYDMENGDFICIDCYDTYGDNYKNPVPPPPPKSEPPSKNSMDNFVTNFDVKVNLNPPKPKNDEKKLEVDLLPAVQRGDAPKTTNTNTSQRPSAPPTSQPPASQPPASQPPAKTPDTKDKEKSVCDKCSQPLQGSYTVYDEKKYHPKCFACCQCNQELKEKSFFKLNGKPLCRMCHSQNLVTNASKCRKCLQPILDTVVTFKSGEYHDYCLVCTMCSGKLVGQSIYTDTQDNPYCVECFTKKESKICAKCNKTITPNQTNLMFDNKTFHKECFICSNCSKIISSTESFYKSEKDPNGVICESCI